MSSKYNFDLIQWIQSQENMYATLILYPSNGANKNLALTDIVRNFLRRLLNSFFSPITAIEILILKRNKKNKRYTDHFKTFDLSNLVNEIITISPSVSQQDFTNGFSEVAIQQIKKLDCDLLVHLSDSKLSGNILNTSRYGLLSLRYAGDGIHEGQLAGFWEVYKRQDTTAFAIQRLTDEFGKGTILMQGRLPTKYCFLLNQASLFEKSYHYLKMLISKTALNGRLPDALPSAPYPNQLLGAPSIFQTILYLSQLSIRLGQRFVNRIIQRKFRWSVAFLHSDWKNAELGRGIELNNPPFHFLADPFVINKADKNYCFVEDFNYSKDRGEIAVYELQNNKAVRLGTALSENFHLSFPFLFEYEGQLFMCPETCENKDIRIYRCHDFPLGWRLEKIIMSNVSAVDTMIFQRSEKWWMFTNIDPIDNGDHCSELLIFHSTSPFGNWMPHSLNPVFVDASCARNAGLITEGDKIFRVSQGQGFDLYGRQILINEIAELTDDTYREVCIKKIVPNFKNDISGTHHLHSNGKLTVFDYGGFSSIRN
jgi:hypothetical protein